MKISYNWLKQYIHTDKSAGELSQILTNIGLEVENLERVQNIPGGLQGLVIGHVNICVQHPDADRLHIVKVDIGTGADLQIVCGAPNIAAGQKVIVAPVGTTVYPNTGEPFKINKSKIRGEISEGMICAEDEIGLGQSHQGIVVLAPDAVPGNSVKDFLHITDDYVFEIGLTPNRADAASHLGVARDLAAYLNTSVIIPSSTNFQVDNHDLPVPVLVENEQACPRYSSITISGVEVKESPAWLKDKLSAIGVRPINNIVDATNYILHGLGQPMHAFDADKITGGKVLVKNCIEGAAFITLDGVERKLSSDDLMICNSEAPMCIAGVFGGIGSGITASTRNIFLESAFFNAVSVRKTAKRHGLKTDASFRFERGTDPDATIFALKQAALLIKDLAGGQISSELSDFYPAPVLPFEISISYKNINRLIGKGIPQGEIKSILLALNIEIVAENDEGLEIKVPPYKVDVTREVDVIEEILRIYGYNNVEIPSQLKASLNFSVKPDREVLQNQIADMLSANGFYEIITNSLTKSAYANDTEQAVRILNPLSIDLDVMRQSLLFTGLEAIAYNQNRRSTNIKFYEFGRIYNRVDNNYKENSRLSIFITGFRNSEQWNIGAQTLSFFDIKSVVDGIIERLNIKGTTISDVTNTHLGYGLSYLIGQKELVQFGSLSKQSLNKADISKEVFYADFNWDLVIKCIQNTHIKYHEVSKFPAVRRDLSILIDKSVSFARLKQIAHKTESKLLKEVGVFDVYEGVKLPESKKSYALSFLLQDAEKTLNDKQIDGIMQKLIVNFEKEAGAEVRK